MKKYLFFFFILISSLSFGQNHLKIDRMINSAHKFGAFPSICIDGLRINNRSVIKNMNIPKKYISKIKLSDALIEIETKIPYLINGKTIIEDRSILRSIKSEGINKVQYLTKREAKKLFNIKTGLILICTTQQVSKK